MVRIIFVIFGATGDLTQRKLLPAFYNLMTNGMEIDILAIGRRDKEETFAQEALAAVDTHGHLARTPEADKTFLKHIRYHRMDITDESAYTELQKQVGAEAIYYFATSPSLFKHILKGMQHAGMTRGKVMFEKPFGENLDTARKLNKKITKVFPETSIYRIDHYLGKESVQNLLVLRLANRLFDAVWNRDYIDHVQITVAESIGVATRGNYYDHAGALKDMVKNHLFQLLMLVAMEPPATLDARAIHDEKVKVLRAMKPFSAKRVKEDVVRGQYRKGTIAGEEVKGYLQEENIPKKSTTETFIAMKMLVDNHRWKDVPFYLRTGKRLAKREAEITIQFKQMSHPLFPKLQENIICIRLQPDAGISLQFNTKHPGDKIQVHPVIMDFCHDCVFGPNTPEAYEQLLQAAIKGDATLFARWDEVEESWKLVEPIMKHWKQQAIPTYAAGSMGPREAKHLLERDGRRWHL